MTWTAKLENPSAGDREIVQSRFGQNLHFDFRCEELAYASRDSAGEHRFSARYEDILVRHPSYLTVNDTAFARRFSLATIVTFALLCAWIMIARPSPPLAALLFLIVLVAFILIRLRSPFSIHFAVLPVSLDSSGTPGYPLHVMDDETGALVIDEIARRRRNRLRLIHAFVDSDRDLERELAKFDWLKENEAIDEHEYQAALAELREAAGGTGPDRRLH